MPSLDELIKDMNKKAKSEVVAIGLTKLSNCARIPFTSPRMNYCTFGGIPMGKIIEFYGEEHGGKTTTALDIIANYQRMEGAKKVLYVDVENGLDRVWAEKLGVDVDNMIIFTPEEPIAEPIFDFICDAVATGEVGLWILDSIGALGSQQESEKSISEKTYAGISGPLTVFGRRAESLCMKYHSTGIAINQIRDDLGAMWAGAKKTPGGHAWRHYTTVRLEFAKGKYIDEKGNDLSKSAETPAGNYIIMSMTKNRTCPPTRRTGYYTIRYDSGVDYLGDLLDVAIKYGVVSKSGAWYSIVDVESGEEIVKTQGKSALYDYLQEEANEKVLTMIEEFIDAKIAM